MIDAVESRRRAADRDQKSTGSGDIFKGWWLQSFGYALAALYLVYFIILYRSGNWIVRSTGQPIYTDFGNAWAAGLQALHGNAAALYVPAELAKIKTALFGRTAFFYTNWPYPPTFFLILAPLSLLPYLYAFIAWDAVTLLGCLLVVYLIVRSRPAIALALATPFTAWNFLAAHNGFLTATFLGASLLCLERRPLVAGIFIGCLTYKPQFGILIPVALVAAQKWRATAAAAVAAGILLGVSIAAFGTGVWMEFPRQLVAQTGVNLLSDADSNWGYLQSVYGLVRTLHGSSGLAWVAQAITTAGAAAIAWIVWRSRISHPLKSAALSAAALLATPYAFAYDMAALVVPAAFLAKDQLSRGLLAGEKAMWIVLFGVPLAVLVTLGDNAGQTTFGGTPVSLLTTVILLAVVVRRAAAMPAGTRSPSEATTPDQPTNSAPIISAAAQPSPLGP